jgi:hypothetical protein
MQPPMYIHALRRGLLANKKGVFLYLRNTLAMEMLLNQSNKNVECTLTPRYIE